MYSIQTVDRLTQSQRTQLCYSRGTVIPLFLTLEAHDVQAIDLLGAPGAIIVSLRRRVRYFNKTCTSRHDVAWNEAVDDICTAMWWPSTSHDARSSPTIRHLEGEVRLPKDLRPTSEMGHFSISVSTVPSCRFRLAFFVESPSKSAHAHHDFLLCAEGERQ